MSRHLFPRRLPGAYYLRVEDAAAAEVATAREEKQVQRAVTERVQEQKT